MPLLEILLACANPAELWIAGDLHRGDTPTSGLDALAREVPYDRLWANLEGPVASAPPPGQAVPLHNPASVLPRLREARVSAVGIVNNHALGGEVLAGTAREVAAAGLAPLTTVPARPVRGGPEVVQFDLESPGALAGIRGVPPHPGAWDLVVLLHASGPPSMLPSIALRTAVDAALAVGADVVASHGTHRIGPVERRGAAVIAWGLGNLAFACACTTEPDGLLLHVTSARAEVWPLRVGELGADTHVARDPDALFDLLAALGSSPLDRHGPSASF